MKQALMRKGVFKITLLILTSYIFLSVSSCQKSPINGDLDGRWQIMEIFPEPGNVADWQHYMSFYMHVCKLTSYGSIFTDGNLRYENNEIFLDFPYVKESEDIEKLKTYGIYSNPVIFKIEHLDKKSLILKEGDIVITLRKF